MLSKKESRERWREVRDLVNEWDPVDLIDAGAPPDEYECVVGPLLRMLEEAVAADEIAHYLENEFAEHFGVPRVSASEFACRAVTWYRSEWSSPSSSA